MTAVDLHQIQGVIDLARDDSDETELVLETTAGPLAYLTMGCDPEQTIRVSPKQAREVAAKLVAWAAVHEPNPPTRLSAADLATMRELAEAASPGSMQFGQMPAEPNPLKLAEMTAAETGNDPERLWCTWFGPADGSTIVAITGNGRRSEANARFFATAQLSVTLLLDEVDRLSRLLEEKLPPPFRIDPKADTERPLPHLADALSQEGSDPR